MSGAVKTPVSGKPRRGSVDLGAAMDVLANQAAQQTDSRFSRANAVVEQQPSAIGPGRDDPAPGADGAARSSVPPAMAAQAPGSAFDVRALQVGQTYLIPVGLIDPNPYSPRFFYRSTQVDATAVSMQEKGQLAAANGYVKEGGRIGLIEGGTRLRAAKASGADVLEVKIERPPASELELYNRAAAFHDERTNHTALDTAMLLRKLLEEGHVTSQDELCTKVKINGQAPSKTTVSKYLRVSRHIPERLLRMMADHEVTSNMRAAYEISSFFVDERFKEDPSKAERLAEDVIQEAITKELTVSQIEQIVQAKLAGPKTRARAEATPVKFGTASGSIKTFEQRGQLDFSIRGLDGDRLNKLKALIEDVCAGRRPLEPNVT
jgi:ParB family transcriptional regulator, chromosome partitioning protein